MTPGDRTNLRSARAPEVFAVIGSIRSVLASLPPRSTLPPTIWGEARWRADGYWRSWEP